MSVVKWANVRRRLQLFYMCNINNKNGIDFLLFNELDHCLPYKGIPCR